MGCQGTDSGIGSFLAKYGARRGAGVPRSPRSISSRAARVLRKHE
jgi:hypothetical protein